MPGAGHARSPRQSRSSGQIVPVTQTQLAYSFCILLCQRGWLDNSVRRWAPIYIKRYAKLETLRAFFTHGGHVLYCSRFPTETKIAPKSVYFTT